MIKIGIKGKDKGEYVGRPTALGNPFVMKTMFDRDEVCDKYEKWFYEHKNDNHIARELARFLRIYLNTGKLTLTCHCTPGRCHAETIKKYLEKEIEKWAIVEK